MTWEISTLVYLLFTLTIYPVSSVKLGLVDLVVVIWAGALLVTGFLRVV